MPLRNPVYPSCACGRRTPVAAINPKDDTPRTLPGIPDFFADALIIHVMRNHPADVSLPPVLQVKYSAQNCIVRSRRKRKQDPWCLGRILAMTTAHRATWKAAQGGEGEEGSFRLHAQTSATSAKDAPANSVLKSRDTVLEASRDDVRSTLILKERDAKRARLLEKGMFADVEGLSEVRVNALAECADPDTDIRARELDSLEPASTKDLLQPSTEASVQAEKLHRPSNTSNLKDYCEASAESVAPETPTRMRNADEVLELNARVRITSGGEKNVQSLNVGNHSISNAHEEEDVDDIVDETFGDRSTRVVNNCISDDDDDDEYSESDDEEEELRAELERIRAERAAEAGERKQASSSSTNPLLPHLNDAAENSLHFGVKRRWDDDVVFRNQAKGEKETKPRFINDTTRNDFHKRFLKRYIR